MVATSGHFPEALLQKNEHRTEPWTTQPGRGEAAEGQTARCHQLPPPSRPPSSVDRPPLGVVLLVCLHETLAQDRPPTHGLTETLGLGFSPLLEKRSRAMDSSVFVKQIEQPLH